ncbi:MAG: hypothetical protein V3W44_08640 [Dehalococcoidales bacterium]
MSLKDYAIVAVEVVVTCLAAAGLSYLVVTYGPAWASMETVTVGPQEYCEKRDPDLTAVRTFIDPDGKVEIVCVPPHQTPTLEQAAKWCVDTFGTLLVNVMPNGYIHCAPPRPMEEML